LANRLNVVLSRNLDYKPDCKSDLCVFPSLTQALDHLNAVEQVKEIFIIGGQSLFEEAISEQYRHLCKMIIATRINKDYESDVFMPAIEDHFTPLYISQTYS